MTQQRGGYLRQAQKVIPDMLGILTGVAAGGLMIYLSRIIFGAEQIPLPEAIQVAILIFIAGTMFVGIWSNRRDHEFSQSEAYLENAVALINKALEVLTTAEAGPTNDRVTWVTAARLLTRAEAISDRISVEAHKAIFQAEHDYQRHRFANLLRLDGKSLPAAFFVGGDQVKPGTIGEAAHHPSQVKDGGHWIPVRILAVVYRFFQYPEGYEDPLDRASLFSEAELDRLWLLDQRGVCDYVIFRKLFNPIGTKVVYIPHIKSTHRYKSAEQIDEIMQQESGKFGDSNDIGYAED
jgi:hypothetical protein